ncbi:YfiR family protein [Syntrophus sp. (in: bacteria)]|uniref:YfiR family protein n=1 Tax=Syntrophus sp. (in: bacteria) TaxID=48412 RepID=UPI00345ED08E
MDTKETAALEILIRSFFSLDTSRTRKIFRILLLFFLIFTLSGWNSHQAEAAEPDPSQVKAAFVYNFIKFVFWPRESMPPDAPDITLCVLGNDPLGNALESLSGKAASGKALSVKRIASRDEASICQVLYICRSESRQVKEILKDLPRGVLTIGDMKNFAAFGGMINFVIKDRKVSFEINPDAAATGEMQISSKLLRLAKLVRNSR